MSLVLMSAGIQNRATQIEREMEVMAGGVANQVMNFVASRSFDERTTPDNITRLGVPPRGSYTTFSRSQDFGSDPLCNVAQPFHDLAICDDIDDVHMGATQWQMINFPIRDTLFVPFEVNVQVFYVDPLNQAIVLRPRDRSDVKKVVVRVRNVLNSGGEVERKDLARIERTYRYEEAAAVADRNTSTAVCLGSETRFVSPRLVPVYMGKGAYKGAC